MSDLIDRQAAIAMCRKPCMRNADCSDFEMEIMMLPPIQPEITHEQAVEYLQSTGWMREHDLQMMLDGVHRLTAQPATNCSEFPNNSDTISRQDAVSRQRLLSDLKELITAWEKYPVMAEQIKGVEVAIGYVELIPSAQPDHIADDSKKASYSCGHENDLISRQAAIDAIHCDITITGRQNAELVAATIGAFADRIKALPSAQPEIVRCKDCKHYRHGLCMKASMCVNKSENGFCDWAERREVTT